jgi:hypothetical protein
MKRWSGIILVCALLAGIGVFAWYRAQPGPEEYIAAAQNAAHNAANGQRTNSRILGESCGPVEWRYSRSNEGQHMVTATGSLKEGGRLVEVRWEVTILRDGNSKVSVANPVSATLDGVDIQPPSAFPGKITAAAPGK